MSVSESTDAIAVARLIYLTGGTYQTWAAIWAFAFPKVFIEFWTDRLDGWVHPLPVLQVVNLLFGVTIIALNCRWLSDATRTPIYAYVLLILHLLAVVPAFLLYQTTNVAIYLSIGSIWW